MANQNNPFFIFFVLLFSLNFSQAQTDISIGEWKSHLPYQTGKHITQSEEHIIYCTNWGIVYIDKDDNSIKTLDKLDGLSGVGIERIKYNAANDILIIAYSNSVIDLVKPNQIITLSDIQRFNNISGDKRIYDIFLDTDSTAFLATGYGISKINLNQDVFVFSTFTGTPVYGVTVKDNQIYATTDEGIYRAPNQTNVNLQDFGIWEYLDVASGFPIDYSASKIVVFNDKIYVGVDTTLLSYSNGVVQQIHTVGDNFSLAYLTAEGEHLVAGYSCSKIENGEEVDCTGKLFYIDTNDAVNEISSFCTQRPSHALEDENGKIWIADAWGRFRKFDTKDEFCDQGFSLNSPFSVKNYDIELNDGNLWVTAGGVTIQNYFQFWFEGLYSKIDGEWNFYNRLNRQDLQGTLDFLKIAFHPEKEITYVSTFFDGLLKFENNEFEIFVDSNSTLDNSSISDTALTRTTGLAFDENNNLWIGNFNSPTPIAVLMDDGTMKSFAIDENVRGLFNLAIDDNGYKWFTVVEGTAGLLVFDDGDEENGDEDCRLITSGNSNLPTNQVNTITKDLDGDMWVGTGDGIIIFECGSNVFDEEQCRGTRKIVEQDGIPAYLLVGEDVRTITVDGANRKWVGTTNGVFLLSEDGEELIAKYNVENSPIFNNVISDIAIDPMSGEVYIGTAEGIISYRSDATLGGRTHESKALVFPNPVRPDYQGTIAIKGLARDSNVKITDINGQLVFETQAQGGQAVWNGKDYSGRKAASGVYLVLGTTTKNLENPQSIVAKILFIN